MESLVMSFVAALTAGGNPEGNPGKVCIIVPRPRAYLADLLAKAFEGREDVEVIVDRRYGERRAQKRSVGTERRRGQRRRPKEEVIEVVIGKIGQPEEHREGPG
jgi:hypothetical protein